MGYTSVEIDAMTPAERVRRQDEIARAYLARAEARDAEKAAAYLARAQRIVQWTNGPCVYCGKNDGFTEVRSMGPVHLERCIAGYNVVQQRKAVACRSRS